MFFCKKSSLRHLKHCSGFRQLFWWMCLI
jgi:hypothetical protein